VADEELIQLLPLELELILCVLLDSVVVGNGVVLRGEEGFEGHHGRLRAVVVRRCRATAAVATSVAVVVIATVRVPVITVVPEIYTTINE
jgi:hypothetical protein